MNQYYLEYQLKILDVMLEKGKGPILRKLRTRQLIEVDLQMIMRVFINGRTRNNTISNKQIPKANCRSHRGYSIDNLILEK